MDELVENAPEAVNPHNKVVGEIVECNNSYEGALEERESVRSNYGDKDKIFGF